MGPSAQEQRSVNAGAVDGSLEASREYGAFEDSKLLEVVVEISHPPGNRIGNVDSPSREGPNSLSSMPGRIEVRGALVVGKGTAGNESRKIDFLSPTEVSIFLERGSPHTLRASVEDYWAAPVVILPEQVTGPIHMELWPAGVLRAAIAGPGSQPPETALVQILARAAKEKNASDTLQKLSLECPVDALGQLSCVAPAGILDLQLRSHGHIPHYFWDVHLRAGSEHDLGKLQMQPGASVFGQVELLPALETSSHGIDWGFEGVTVQLEPTPGPTGSSPPQPEGEKTRHQLRALSATPNSEGIFQIAGAQAGLHDLVVEKEGYSTARLEGIEVFPGSESVVREPIQLSPPIAVEIFADPPTTPEGEPWDLHLYEARTRKEVRAGIVDLTGGYLASGLDSGKYLLEIGLADPRQGRRDQRWHFEEIELDASTPVHFVNIPVIPIEGQLRRGDTGFAAHIWFGTRHGKQSLALRSEDDGAFDGFLPREGEWQVEISLAKNEYRRLAPVDIRAVGGIAHVEIELPDNSVHGKVLDGEGAPVAGAGVVISNVEHHGKDVEARTDEVGHFEVHGLRHGLAHAQASAPEGTSQWQAFDIPEKGSSPEIELVLRRSQRLRGRLSSTRGPIPGARLVLAPEAQGQPVNVAYLTTGPDGEFRTEIPATSTSCQVVVMSPSHGFFLRRLSWPSAADLEKRPLELRVSLQETGELRLDLGERPLRSFVLFLDGQPISGQFLAEWHASQARIPALTIPESEGSAIRIPKAQAGSWILCPMESFDLAALAAGQPIEPGNTCSEGQLPALGTVELAWNG